MIDIDPSAALHGDRIDILHPQTRSKPDMADYDVVRALQDDGRVLLLLVSFIDGHQDSAARRGLTEYGQERVFSADHDRGLEADDAADREYAVPRASRFHAGSQASRPFVGQTGDADNGAASPALAELAVALSVRKGDHSRFARAWLRHGHADQECRNKQSKKKTAEIFPEHRTAFSHATADTSVRENNHVTICHVPHKYLNYNISHVRHNPCDAKE